MQTKPHRFGVRKCIPLASKDQGTATLSLNDLKKTAVLANTKVPHVWGFFSFLSRFSIHCFLKTPQGPSNPLKGCKIIFHLEIFNLSENKYCKKVAWCLFWKNFDLDYFLFRLQKIIKKLKELPVVYKKKTFVCKPFCGTLF